MQAFGAVWEFFWNPPAEHRSDLIPSWMYMAVSIVTTAGAVALLHWQSRADNTRKSFAVPCGHYRFKLLCELRDRLPAKIQQFFPECQRQRLAYPMQQGHRTSQQEAQCRYWQHLINLYDNVIGF